MPGERENDQIVRPAARNQPVDRGHHGGAADLLVDQRRDVAGPGIAQRPCEVARVGGCALQRPNVTIGVDADDEGAHLAAVGASQRAVCGGGRAGAEQRKAQRACGPPPGNFATEQGCDPHCAMAPIGGAS